MIADVTLVDLFRDAVFVLGAAILSGLLVATVRAYSDLAWASFFRNVASVAGVSFLLIELSSRFGSDRLTWRTPLALFVFVAILLGISASQRGYH